MKLYVPEIGDKLKLIKPWSLALFTESRNTGVLEFFNLPFSWELRETSNKVTIPKGCILTVDRIYIRKGLTEFSSISFFIEGLAKKKLRFWAKLEDCNNIEFDIVSQAKDSKPPLKIYVPDVKKLERYTTHKQPPQPKESYNDIFGICDSVKYDADPVMLARVTYKVENEVYDTKSLGPLSIYGKCFYIESKKSDIKFELLDLSHKPLNVTANNKQKFVKAVKEYWKNN